MTTTNDTSSGADTSPGTDTARPPLAAQPKAAGNPRRLPWGQANRFTGLLLFAIIVVVFATWIPATFLTNATFRSVAGDQAITLVLAIGALFTLAAGQYDLSVAQNLGFSAVVAAHLMSIEHLDPWVAVGVTLAIGAVIGLVNGFIVAYVGVNSFIATLGMSSVLLALTEEISNNQFIGPVPHSFQALTTHTPLGVPIVTVFALVCAVLAWWALEHHPFGRWLAATGANPEAARLAGVPTTRYVTTSFVITGMVSSLAGILVCAKIGQVSPSIGPPYLLPAFAACFLGTTQFKLGRFNVWGTVLALYLLATGVKGLQLTGGQLWITDLFNGLALIVAVSLAVVSQRRRLPSLARWRRERRSVH